MRNRLKKALAFTITELVIVIAVIAILAAVLIPTFSHVIDESKKSHDTQYMREINTAIANYAALHDGVIPQDYDKLMVDILNEAGLCDPSNPFLLMNALKQEHVYLVWFPGTDKVQLVDETQESMLFSPSGSGLGNAVQLYNVSAGNGEVMDSALAYVLCTTGNPDCERAANLYRDYYILAGGDITEFWNSGALDGLNKDMENKSWANSIVSSFKNAKQGYTFNQSTADNILEEFEAKSSANVDLTENLPQDQKEAMASGGFSALKPESRASIQQGVRGTLATLASLENNPATKESVSGKKVELEVPEGTTVDMTDVTLTPVGTSYRKEQDVNKGTPESTLSVDFGDVTLENLEIPKETFVSTGAEMQNENDSGYKGGAYAFTYGLFGTVVAGPGKTTTIENLHLKDIHFDFTGATESISGDEVNTFADNAGIVVGYAQGNVELKNITIDGEDASGNRGLIKGYDGISGVIGRAYACMENGGYTTSTVTLTDVTVKNMNIEGERRAAGFVGYFNGKGSTTLKINNCALENVTITAIRDDRAGDIKQCWAMAIANCSTYASGSIFVDGLTLTNVYTGVKFFDNVLGDDAAFFQSEGTALSLGRYAYLDVSELGFARPLTFAEGMYKYLLLAEEKGGTMKNVTLKYDDNDKQSHTFTLAGAEDVTLNVNQKYTVES